MARKGGGVTFKVKNPHFTQAHILSALTGLGYKRVPKKNQEFTKRQLEQVRDKVIYPVINDSYRSLYTSGLQAVLDMQVSGESGWQGSLSTYNRIRGRGATSVSGSPNIAWPSLNRAYRKRKLREGRSGNFRSYSGELNRELANWFNIGAVGNVVARAKPFTGGTKFTRPRRGVKQGTFQINPTYTLFKFIQNQNLHDYVMEAFVTGDISAAMKVLDTNAEDKVYSRLTFMEAGRGKNPQRRIIADIASRYRGAMETALRNRK